MKTAIEMIADERKRQIEVEGFTIEQDDVYYDSGDLALAGACYALGTCAGSFEDKNSSLYKHWPFGEVWWKPTPNNRIRELIKAGALIVAEIERLQRIEQNKTLKTN